MKRRLLKIAKRLTMKRQRTIRRWFRLALVGCVAVTTLATIAGYLGSVWWACDLFSHFRLQYASALTLFIVWSALCRAWTAGAIALLALLVNGYEVGSLYIAASAPASEAKGPTLRLIHLNAWHVRNRHPDLIADYIRSLDADVVLIQETGPEIIASLDSLLSQYRWAARPDHQSPFRSAVLVKGERSIWELTSIEDVAVTYGPNENVGLGSALRMRQGAQTVSILHPHVTAPGTYKRHMARQSEFSAIIDWVAKNPGNAIVIGDLNSTPWSLGFRALLSGTGMVNSQQGFGLQATWPRRPPHLLTWVFRIPIDHCLHTTSITTTDRRVGPYVGSDHFPLAVSVELLHDGAASGSR